MFWSIVGGLFALVLLAAWLADRRNKQRHTMLSLTESKSPRHGSANGRTEAHSFGAGDGRRFGGVMPPTGGTPTG
jgi:hypothetical protein